MYLTPKVTLPDKFAIILETVREWKNKFAVIIGLLYVKLNFEIIWISRPDDLETVNSPLSQNCKQKNETEQTLHF